jgi:predicted DNA-binding transcriptional regulator AlpA
VVGRAYHGQRYRWRMPSIVCNLVEHKSTNGNDMADMNLLRPAEAASLLRLSISTLAKMRMRGDGPPYVKSGHKVVLYRSSDLQEWLARRRRSSTSEAEA